MGLAYSDFMGFDFSKISEKAGIYFLCDKRNKMGVEYCAVFLLDTMNIVKKYKEIQWNFLSKVFTSDYSVLLIS